jgi:glycosyltransferase involved in cell wall biosynthesis
MRPYRPDLRLLPNALDLAQYPFSLRRSPRPRLVWLRAFHRIYNPTLAPKVIARLAREFPDVCLSMVGPDKGDGSLQATERLAAELGIAERIVWPGGVPKADVPAWLSQGDIFLNTANVDNTPVSILEAMACGLCVVSTNVGGIPYLLEHEKDALLVSPDDPDAMTAAVRRVLTEPALAERLSRNARRKAEQFNWATILPQWEDLLRSIVR